MKKAIYRKAVLCLICIIVVMGAGLSYFRATTASSDAVIVAPLGRAAMISAAPGRADAENTFIIGGISATALRLLSRSLDMDMGITVYMAKPLGGGQWQVTGMEAPMVGRWGIDVQARRHQAWVSIGNIAYDVPFTGQMRVVHRRLVDGD